MGKINKKQSDQKSHTTLGKHPIRVALQEQLKGFNKGSAMGASQRSLARSIQVQSNLKASQREGGVGSGLFDVAEFGN